MEKQNENSDQHIALTELPNERHELRLQRFMKLLHRDPVQPDVQAYPTTPDSKYLPISVVEMHLDELFFGLWETAAFDYRVGQNELSATLLLKVFHPVARCWIARTGVASVLLRDESGRIGLEKALPQLKAECIKNAARSLGKLFGRDLNRDYQSSYKPILKAQST